MLILLSNLRRDQRAVASLRGLAVAPSPSRPRPFHFATARSSRADYIAQPRTLPLGAWLRSAATSFVPVLPLRNRSASAANISTKAPAAASVADINPTEILEPRHPSANRRQFFVDTNVVRGHPSAPARAKGVLESVQRGGQRRQLSQNLRSKSNTVGRQRMPPSEGCSQNNEDSKTQPANQRDQRMLRSAIGLH